MRAKALPAQPAPRMDRRAGGRGGAPEEAAWDAGIMMESAPSIATADEAGELFAYHIDTPVSIPRQHSAMLSILNAPVQGKKVSIYNPATHAKHPLNGLVLTNTTGLHLMQGPITVFDGGLYAGDAKLPDVKPDEQRMIAYALDLSTEVTVERKSTPDELMSLWIKKGVLWRRHKYVDQRDYLIKNKAGKARTVILEQPYTNDWKLVAPAEPHERTDDVLRFKVDAPAQQTARQTVVLERIRDESMILTDTGLDQIRFYLRSPVISPAVRQAMEQVIALRTELDELARRRERLEQEQREAVNEQVRVRDNLKTLDRNTDAYRRQLTLFDALETQIGDSRAQVDRARDEEEQKRKELEAYLLSLNVE
jgi:FtsZ-binding cell division protein ZapB